MNNADLPRVGSGARGGAELRLENLAKRFGDGRAVDDVSVSIAPGEFLSLLGPSGSGKTTTLLMIAGFQMPTSGEIYVDGVPIVYEPPHKRNIGMVFQNYALFPHMTVFKNIAFPLEMRNVGRSAVDQSVRRVLDLVQLRGYEPRYPRQLSGGQQQRVALARAIVHNPPILLMDEPLGALDRKLREEMQLEIKRIQEALHITVVYVTHDQAEALTMSDRIAVMNRGRIEQLGTPEDLYEHPANLFVAEFVGESNVFNGRIERLAGGTSLLRSDDGLLINAGRLHWMREGELVHFVVRPERASVAREEGRHSNTFEAVVEEAIYVGETRKYEVSIGAGRRVVVKSPNAGDGRSYVRGEKVSVAWNVEDVICLPASLGAVGTNGMIGACQGGMS